MEYGSALADELEDHPDEPEPTSDGDDEDVEEEVSDAVVSHCSTFQDMVW